MASLKTIAVVTSALTLHVQQSWAKLLYELGPDLLSKQSLTVAIALSGGRDSIALAFALKQLRATLIESNKNTLRLMAFVLDHHLQQQSAQWRTFCEQWCDEQGIEFYSQQLQVKTQGQGIEAAARSARYTAFKSLAQQHQAHVLALGHHQDDQAETVLLQLARGTGLGGASAMPEVQLRENLIWWRPLLHVSRNEINGYVQAQELRFIEDPSNNNVDFRRNAIRLHVLPALEKAFSQTKKSLAQFALHAAQAQSELTAIAQLDYAQCLDVSPPELFWADFAQCADCTRGPVLLVAELRKLSTPRQQRVLRRWMQLLKFAPIELAQMLELIEQCVNGTSQASPVVKFQGQMISRYRERLYAYQSVGASANQRIEWVAIESDGFSESHQSRESLVIAIRSGQETLKLAHNRPSRSLKQHFQTLGIPPWLRERAVLLKRDDQLVWAQGIGFDARFSVAQGAKFKPVIFRPS